MQAVEAVTGQVRGVACCFGGQAGLFGAAARYYAQWVVVPASEVELGMHLADEFVAALGVLVVADTDDLTKLLQGAFVGLISGGLGHSTWLRHRNRRHQATTRPGSAR